MERLKIKKGAHLLPRFEYHTFGLTCPLGRKMNKKKKRLILVLEDKSPSHHKWMC